ncbi:MAG TPA: glycosyltransferase [Candidatus Limnocylindrales bacterium]|nr:glycosyltransferase [Candidatus Limnocylindrales bacterium]
MKTTLARIRRAPSVLDVIPLVGQLVADAAAAATGGGASIAREALLEAVREDADAPTAIAAAHAIIHLPSVAVDDLLADILSRSDWLAPHVAWSLADRAPVAPLIAPLIDLLEGGRLGGMLAQQTLQRWAAVSPRTIAQALGDRLDKSATPGARGRLVETLGLAVGPEQDGDAALRMAGIALDPGEAHEARVAAIAALGDQPGADREALERIVDADDVLAPVARLALLDHRLAARHARRSDSGLHVAQVHLGGYLDRALAHAGQGSTGGIATLLVQLGDALAADARVSSVTTIGRRPASETVTSLAFADAPHTVVAAPLGSHEDTSFTGDWPALVAAERAIRRVLAHRPATLLHLRMADVGSLAASRLARQRGIPTIFTLAPDPHGLIREMERAGELDRAAFGPADAAGALWFRTRLVRHLADTARQVVLFPRSGLSERLRDLVGVDVTASAGRYHVVPEGVDPEPIRAASREIAQHAAAEAPIAARSAPRVPSVLDELCSAIEALGTSRSGLPLVVSVGRLAEVKGMARLVEAFAEDVSLRRRANLVIVGGDLDAPTPEERAEFDRIEATLARVPEMAGGVVLLGHRPHADVLRVIAAAEQGLGAVIGAGGAYACASRKEEFGLAIVEALASGLPVVAPLVGGPPSYVEDGVTGRLVDTLDRDALTASIHDALDLAGRPGRADRARSLVAERFTMRAMADTLVPIYAVASREPVAAAA